MKMTPASGGSDSAGTGQTLVADELQAYRDLLAAAPAGIMIHDMEGGFLYANQWALDLHGYTRAEFMTLNLRTVVAPESTGLIAERIGRLQANGQAAFEVLHRRKDGTVIPLLVRARTLRWENCPAILSVASDMTEHQQEDERLRESEEILRYIVKYDPNAIAVYDRQLHYIAVSDRYLHDYNVKAADILGKHHYEVFPEMPQKWKDVHQRCLAGAVEGSEDDFFERPDGTITHNRWICRPWHHAHGEIGGIVTYTEVTTERKRAEESLRASEERFRTLADNMPDVVARFDLQLRHLYVNRRNEAVTGKPASVFIGKTNRELGMPPELTEHWEAASRRALATGKEVQIEFVFSSPNGARYFESRLIPEKGEDGEPATLLALARDITERKQAEANREENRQLTAQLAEKIPMAIAMLDPEMRYIVANRAWLDQYRLGDRNIIGLSHYDVFPEIDERWKEIHRRCLAGAVERCEEDSFPRADGSLDWLRWEVRPWHKANGQVGGLIMYTEVITERKQAEARLTEQVDELRRWHDATLGREKRILTLKREVNELLATTGQPSRYASTEAEADADCIP